MNVFVIINVFVILFNKKFEIVVFVYGLFLNNLKLISGLFIFFLIFKKIKNVIIMIVIKLKNYNDV